jgi:hypothetical protein
MSLKAVPSKGNMFSMRLGMLQINIYYVKALFLISVFFNKTSKEKEKYCFGPLHPWGKQAFIFH